MSVESPAAALGNAASVWRERAVGTDRRWVAAQTRLTSPANHLLRHWRTLQRRGIRYRPTARSETPQTGEGPREHRALVWASPPSGVPVPAGHSLGTHSLGQTAWGHTHSPIGAAIGVRENVWSRTSRDTDGMCSTRGPGEAQRRRSCALCQGRSPGSHTALGQTPPRTKRHTTTVVRRGRPFLVKDHNSTKRPRAGVGRRCGEWCHRPPCPEPRPQLPQPGWPCQHTSQTLRAPCTTQGPGRRHQAVTREKRHFAQTRSRLLGDQSSIRSLSHAARAHVAGPGSVWLGTVPGFRP